MDKEYIEDLLYGGRLLISPEADKRELKDNIRCARSLLKGFQDMSIIIRAHILEFHHKNPEYIINGEIGDRKGIHSEKGISDAFKRCVEQGCSIVILDLDMHMSSKLLHPRQIAKFLSWRPDFNEGLIRSCYLVYHDRAVVVDSIVKDRDKIAAIIDKLKAER